MLYKSVHSPFGERNNEIIHCGVRVRKFKRGLFEN